MADNRLTDTEALKLAALRDELGVDGKVIDDLRQEHFQSVVDPILARINAVRRFKQEDEQELTELSKDLQIGFQYGDEFRLFRALWEIEEVGTFEPEEVDVNLRLTKNEVCYHECPSAIKSSTTGVQRMRLLYSAGAIGQGIVGKNL